MEKTNFKIEFQENLQLEYSCTPVPQQLGRFNNSMELWKLGPNHYEIEWVFSPVNSPDDEDVEHIGLTFDGKTLTDYDGVFELPKEAVKLIRKAGFRVPKDFLN